MATSIKMPANPAGRVVSDNTTLFFPLGGDAAGQSTEANAAVAVRDAGTYSNLFCNVTQNDIAAATSATVTLRLSAAGTAVTVSYGSSQTGIKEDTTHTVSAVNTNTVDFSVAATSVSGSHTVTIAGLAIQFDPTTTTNCISHMINAAPANPFSTASSSVFYAPNGSFSGSTEANVKYSVLGTFTASNLWTAVSSNARTTTTTFTTRKNGGAGGQSVSYTSTQTGTKEDTSGTDSLTSGDDYNYSLNTGTGTGSITVSVCSTRLVSTSSSFIISNMNSATPSQNFNVNNFFGPEGGTTITTTEANAQIYPRFAFTASKFSVFCRGNTITTSATTVFLRVNGANGNQNVSFAAAETGLKTDSTDTDSIVAGAAGALDYNTITPNTSGVIQINWYAFLGNTVVPVISNRIVEIVAPSVMRASVI